MISDFRRYCDFCFFEVTTDKADDLEQALPLHPIPEEPGRVNSPADLCSFCFASLAAYSWVTGGNPAVDYTISRDLSNGLNTLRAELVALVRDGTP